MNKSTEIKEENSTKTTNCSGNVEPVVMLPMDYAMDLDKLLCEINLKSNEFGNQAMFASISLNKLIEEAKAT